MKRLLSVMFSVLIIICSCTGGNVDMGSSIGPAPDWQDISWMVGQYEGTPIIIAVDADGKIINVMQATYAGVLKPVACDEQGRIIMIPTDPADVWGNAISMGNAELSIRLKGIGGYDRRGQWFWGTDFEDGLQGSTFGGDHADSTGLLSSSRSLQGAFSIKLDPRAAASSYADWKRVLHYLSTGKVGFEVSISLDADPLKVSFVSTHFDGTNALRGQLNYNPATGNWSIYTYPTTWVTILTGYTLQTGSDAWHHVKLVVDTSTEKYVRALIDKYPVDISAYSLDKFANASLGQHQIYIAVWGSVALHAAAYFDGVIFTQNEPS